MKKNIIAHCNNDMNIELCTMWYFPQTGLSTNVKFIPFSKYETSHKASNKPHHLHISVNNLSINKSIDIVSLQELIFAIVCILAIFMCTCALLWFGYICYNKGKYTQRFI